MTQLKKWIMFTAVFLQDIHKIKAPFDKKEISNKCIKLNNQLKLHENNLKVFCKTLDSSLTQDYCELINFLEDLSQQIQNKKNDLKYQLCIERLPTLLEIYPYETNHNYEDEFYLSSEDCHQILEAHSPIDKQQDQINQEESLYFLNYVINQLTSILKIINDEYLNENDKKQKISIYSILDFVMKSVTYISNIITDN